MQGQYSMRSPAVKRLMKEAQELSEPTEQYYAQPLDDNLFEWHFTIRGPGDSEFDGGIYHGRIILPPEYPMKPPSIILLTPNGRFETNKKICLSISGHHPESWQPSWSIRTALLAIIGFMPTHGAGAIGSLNYSSEERKKLAKRSLDWKCPTCGGINYILKAVTSESEKTKQEAKELATQINFQGEKEKKQTDESTTPSAPEPQQNTSTNLQQASVNSDSPNQAFHFPGMPQTFGQMPFTRFPFPPPFMLGSLPASYTSSSVPRFPPPPPFIPGMFPPGLMHTMPNAQQGNMNFMMPSWPGNPYVVSQSQTVSNSHGIVGNQASSGNPSPASGQQGSSLNSEKKTQSTESGMSASAVSESSDLESQVKVDSDSSEALAKPDTSVESGTVDKVVTDNSDNMETVDNTDERIVHEPITNITDHVMEEDNNVTQEEPILRHRTLYNEDIPQTVPAGRVGQTAEIPHEQQQSGITFSTVLIVLIGIAIALLLIRRFFLSRNWKFYYGH